MIANAIRLLIENLPTVFFVLALLLATVTRGIPQPAERYLSWILLSLGLQGVWAGGTHVLFPETAARFIGWQVSPFQFEIGIADIAHGVVALLSFWRPLAFKAAVVTFTFVFYVGLAYGHFHHIATAGNMAPGNAGLLLALTIVQPLLLVGLLIGARISNVGLKRP
jgi:hypothetical protein